MLFITLAVLIKLYYDCSYENIIVNIIQDDLVNRNFNFVKRFLNKKVKSLKKKFQTGGKGMGASVTKKLEGESG